MRINKRKIGGNESRNGDVAEVVSVSTRKANGALEHDFSALTPTWTLTLTTQIGAPALAERLFLVQLPAALVNSS
jgi:hypothetical protein